MKKGIALAITIIVVALGLIWMGLSFTIKSTEIEKRTAVEGQQKKCKTHHANMWNILKEQAGVTEQYRETFEKVFPEMIDGRYANDKNLMFKFVTENNPEFKIELLSNLMQSISIERTGFTNEQDILVDKQMAHKNYILNKFNKMFLDDNLKEVEIQIVASTRTNKAFESGVEDEIELFSKKDTTKK